MSSKDIAVAVRGLSKSYSLAHLEQQTTIREAMLQKARHPFRKPAREEFWALKDVEFDIERGDVVGIIGRNGAGKSTLLKILSNITRPTSGYVDLFGRVGSLLEVGTGFHLELTGRENIYLNGAILGMRRREIERQFDAIVEFSGVEKFLDTPVKRYSSGMFVRLAFAVAAHLNPDILIIDEVLAVGDAEFQKKCLGKMQDVAQEQGRTVLFVSHNEAAVRRLCKSAIYLKNGQVQFIGSPEDAFTLYREQRSDLSFDTSNRRASSGAATIVDARLRVDDLIVTEILGSTQPVLELDVQVTRDVSFYPEILLRDGDFLPTLFAPLGLSQQTLYQLQPGLHRLAFELEFPTLAAGKYFLDFALAQFSVALHDHLEGALGFTVEVSHNPASGWSFEQVNRQGSVLFQARELEVKNLSAEASSTLKSAPDSVI